MELGHKGTLYRDGKQIRARVKRVRGGNRVDLENPNIPPDQLQMIPLGAGEGCFLPDAYEVQPVGPEDVTPQVNLIPRAPEPRWRWLLPLVVSGVALALHAVTATLLLWRP